MSIGKDKKVSKNNWIFVSEKLPDKDGNYLVAHESGRINISLFFAKTDNMNARFIFDDPHNRIIAWLPLPELPEEM